MKITFLGGAKFFNANIKPVAAAEQRNAIVWNPGPAVVVASSGMLAGGPSLSYARALAGKPEHAILLTGYQDEEAPGRRLQKLAERGSGSIRLGADKVDVQRRIATYSLSAHADESQIINLVETLTLKPSFWCTATNPPAPASKKPSPPASAACACPAPGKVLNLRKDPTGLKNL